MRPKIYAVLTGSIVIFSLLQSNAQTNKTLSNLTAPTAVNQSLLPNADSSIDLGSSTKSWRNLYLSHSIYLKNTLTLHATGTSNIFAGSSAGNLSNTGTGNAALGMGALQGLTSGAGNVAGGYKALHKNTSGSMNIAFGYQALYSNTTGHSNIASGLYALYFNRTGAYNIGVGTYALFTNITGNHNTANGAYALNSNSKGHSNVAIGAKALYKSIKNSNLVAVGDSALYNYVGESWDVYGYNTAVGSKALFAATTGYSNTALGSRALYNNTKGSVNTAIGEGALASNTEGNFNTGIGRSAISYNTTGTHNTAIGFSSLQYNRTGSQNTAVGTYAGHNYFDGINNSTSIGYMARATASNQVRIGNTSVTSIGGQVGWTIFSDGRYKKDIKEDVSGLAFINSLRPVTYKVEVARLNAHLNKKSEGMVSGVNKREEAESTLMDGALQKAESIVHTGFVAQEVEEAANKVGYQFDGVDKPEREDGLYGLRYDHFVAPLVKAVQELSKQNDQKDSVIASLEERLLRLEKAAGTGTSPAHNTTLSSASLGQNHPNPFNNTTVIQYTLPHTFTTAQLVITDKGGKTVKQVRISGTGSGTVPVDASFLSSGAYQYSLVIDGKLIATRQMVLSR